MALLKAEHITKTYNQCTILKDINIELHQKDEIVIHEQDFGLCTIPLREEAADLSPDGQPVFDRRHGGDRFVGPPPDGQGAAL